MVHTHKNADCDDIVNCVGNCVQHILIGVPLSGVELVSYCVQEAKYHDYCEENEGNSKVDDEVDSLSDCIGHFFLRELLT